MAKQPEQKVEEPKKANNKRKLETVEEKPAKQKKLAPEPPKQQPKKQAQPQQKHQQQPQQQNKKNKQKNKK